MVRRISTHPLLTLSLALGVLASGVLPTGLGGQTQALVGATILDGTPSGAAIPDGVLIVENGRVTAVGPRSGTPIPAGAQVVDLEGRWLLPGLINAHGHVSGGSEAIQEQLELYARYGVTTVVSLGGESADAFRFRDEQATPALQRARIFVAGPVIAPTTPEGARSEVARVAEMGADWVKIRIDNQLGQTTKMAPEVYAAVIDEARARGLPVAVHIVELEDAVGSVRVGGALVAHSVRDLPVTDELLAAMRASDICLSPTLTRELSTFIYAERPAFFDDPFFREGVAEAEIEGFITPQRQAQQSGPAAQFYRSALPLAQENMRRMFEAGVGIAMGTDSGPVGRFQGYFEHVELEMMVEGGIPPASVLHAATGSAAACMGLAEEVGTLRPGLWADLLVLDADPREEIRNTRSIHSVWVAGNRIR